MTSPIGQPASWAGADLLLLVHAGPGARRTEVAGLHGASIKLRVRARAVEGAANTALLEFLADAFRVGRSRAEMLSGQSSRAKRVRIIGPDRAHAEHVLREWGVLQISS